MSKFSRCVQSQWGKQVCSLALDSPGKLRHRHNKAQRKTTLKINTLLTGCIALALSGCGTISSVSRSDHTIISKLQRQQTYCESVPRVYSGTAYDFCMLHSKPRYNGARYPDDDAPRQYSNNHAPFHLWDMPWPLVLDTIILPYTIYIQNIEGSLKIRK